MTSRILSLVPGLLLLGAGCAPDGEVGASAAPLSGKDGDLAVSAPGTLVNKYAQLEQDVATGDRRLPLRSAAPLMPLTKGDLLLVIQMQGASIDVSDTPKYGEVTALNGAGSYELVTVDSVQGDTVVLDGGCRLRRSYSASGVTQVIRVPQYRSLTVRPGGAITAPPWNGTTGGVVAVHVQEAAQIDGLIDVSGRGFRGGQVDNLSGNNDGMNVIWRSTDAQRGAEKGEGIAGGNVGGRYGRGAPANGGGGGNSHNAAGGGGANGNNGAMWSGQGVMNGAVVGAVAWTLDPGYKLGNRLTASSGGGRGGYTFSQSIGPNNPDPTVLGPGSALWGGDWRREVGGLGGRPVPSDPASRLFLGGGGGAGDGNDMAAGPGASGGGLVLLLGGAVSGTGAITADGAGAPVTGGDRNDAAGGGGGGGTVVVAARALTGVRISANGGKGGDQPSSPKLVMNREAEGPGGGGGGGYIAVSAANVMSSAAGGANGTSASPSVARFPSNGATGGASGQALEVVIPAAVPICFGGEVPPPPDMSGVPGGGSDLSVKITVAPDPVVLDQPETYTISVSNKGPDAAEDVKVSFTVPEDAKVVSVQPGEGWTCTQQGRVITCTRSEVKPGQAPDVVIKVIYPADGTTPVTVEGTVTSSTPDPSQADNKTSVTTSRGGISFAGGGLACSFGPRGGAGDAAAAAAFVALGALLTGLGRRRRAR